MRETRSQDVDKVEITKEGSVIRVKQWLSYVCCVQLALTVEQEGSVLKIIETNTGEICRCICEYRLEADVTDIGPGVWKAQVWGVQYQDLHHLELLGEATIAL